MPDELYPVASEGYDPLAQRANNTISSGLSLGISPDEAGRSISFSAKTGLSSSLYNPKKASWLADITEQDRRLRVLDQNIKLAQWLVDNPLHATVGWDDVSALDNLMRLGSSWGRRISPPTTGDKMEALATLPFRALSSGIGSLTQQIYGLGAFASKNFGLTGSEEWFRRQAETGRYVTTALAASDVADLDRAAARLAELRRNDPLQVSIMGIPLTAEDVGAGAVSMAPAVVASVLSGGSMTAIALTAGAQSAGGRYAEDVESGKSKDVAARNAAISGVITGVLTRFIPNFESSLSRQIKMAANPRLAARTAFAATLGKTAAGEFTEEGLDQFLQAFIIDGKSFRDSFAEGLNAGLVGGILGAGMGFGEARMARKLAQANMVMSIHAQGDEYVKALDSSTTQSRSPEAALTFSQTNMPELNRTVYLDADKIAPMLSDPKTAAALEAVGITKDKVDKALDNGSMLTVNHLEVLHKLPSGIREQIRAEIQLTPAALSKSEAEQIVKSEKEMQEPAPGKEPTQEEAKALKKEMDAEVRRIVKELGAAGIAVEDANKSLQPIIEFAKSAFARDPGIAKMPIDLLKKIRVEKGMSVSEAKAKLKQTSTAVKGLITGQELPPGVASRVDALTGVVSMDKTKGAIEATALQAIQDMGAAIDVSGKTVEAVDETGKTYTVDAGEAVGMMRRKLKQASLLLECLG